MRKKQSPTRSLIVLALLVLGLSGCGDDGMDDLREFIKTAHAGKSPKVEPLPEIKTQTPFTYAAASLNDPFSVSNLKAQVAKATGGGPRPDMNRRKEPLEDYPLDSLKMVGTLARGKKTEAIIQAPDGSVYRVSPGQHLGQNFGAIIRITEEKVSLIELVQGSHGDWVEREASIALAE